MPISNGICMPVEEIIHRVKVRDPYRWLEDRQRPETEEWIFNQRLRCDAYFAARENLSALRDRVRGYLDIEVTDAPACVAGRYFYRRRNQGQEQASIYVRDSDTGEERLLVDPSTLGPFASVGIHCISQDGSLLAYALKDGGGDRKAIHVLEVESHRTLSEFVPIGYARGFSFALDCRGFYYCQEESETTQDHTIRLRRFGTTEDGEECFATERTPGSQLILVADEEHLGAVVSHQGDGKFQVELWLARRSDPRHWNCVFKDRNLPFTLILKQGRLLAITYDEAPNGKLVELDLAGTEIRTVVPEQTSTIRQIVAAGDRVFINYLDRTTHFVHCWSFTGTDLGRIPLPLSGTIQIMRHFGNAEDSVFFSYESFDQPLAILEHKTDSGAVHYWHRRNVTGTNPRCVAREENYPSKDGERIPITLITHERPEQSWPSPVVMTSYGGFGVPMTPRFSVLASVLMELGFTLVLPHIRGGGEFDRAWHEAGRGRNRQVSFDDFIAASKWLCEEITSPAKLAIFGGSNSGLLVGAAMIQAPELFCAVLCIAPLLDMVRYELFDRAARWQNEYGTVANPKDFIALYSCSPYHNVDDAVNYPAVLFVSGDKDDRCNPAHVRKMAGRLQDRSSQRSPVLVDYSDERGHSPVLPLSVRIEALNRRIAFLCHEMEIPLVFGGGDEKASD